LKLNAEKLSLRLEKGQYQPFNRKIHLLYQVVPVSVTQFTLLRHTLVFQNGRTSLK